MAMNNEEQLRALVDNLTLAVECAADAIDLELRKTARGDFTSFRKTLGELSSGFRTLIVKRAQDSADARLAEVERLNQRTQARFETKK